MELMNNIIRMDNNGMMDKKEIKLIIKKYLYKDPFILAVSLLGSAKEGRMTQGSDIDIALMLYPGNSLDSYKKMKIIKDLSFELERLADIGEISSTNLVYSREALLKGEIIFSRDTDLFQNIRANLLGMYLQFNLEREEVINAYRA